MNVSWQNEKHSPARGCYLYEKKRNEPNSSPLRPQNVYYVAHYPPPPSQSKRLCKQDDVQSPAKDPAASSHASVLTLTRPTFSGAIYSRGSTLFVGTGTWFMFNVATAGSGGGVYASESMMSLNGAVFTENNGVQGGGWSQLMLW